MRYQHQPFTGKSGLMKMKRLRNSWHLTRKLLVLMIFFGLGTSILYIPALAGDFTGRDIMVKVKERPEGDDSKSLMKMILIDRRNRSKDRSVLSFKMNDNNNKKTLMYFLAPADIRGTGFLTWEYEKTGKDDDRWIYLPAFKKTRRISGSSKNSYFLGTDFTYDDLGNRAVDEDTHRLLREEEIDGKKCWVIESIPRAKDYIYSKKIYWIWKDAFFGVKVEYYDRMGTLMKILTVQDLRKENGIWTPFKMTMDNIREKHKTIFITEEVNYNQGLEDSLFRVSTLERGNIR